MKGRIGGWADDLLKLRIGKTLCLTHFSSSNSGVSLRYLGGVGFVAVTVNDTISFCV